MQATSGVRGLATASLLGFGTLLAVCYGFHSSIGLAAATTGFLSVLWQVQAGGVSLSLALAVFVFGLLPQSRGRVTYREFLRRSWALPIVGLGVGSILFDGLVLLGIGHQVRPSSPGAGDGHGLAVSVATAVGLVSIASVGLLFGLTVKALDPDTVKSAHDNYRRNVLAEALRAELIQRTCIDLMRSQLGGKDPMLRFDTFVQGRRVEVTASSNAVITDVSLWRLRILRRRAAAHGHQQPVIHCWPGARLPSKVSRSLLTIDPRSSLMLRLWSRRCVQIRAAKPNRLEQVLDALHAETLDAIRADQPLEAINGITTAGDLLDIVWQAYAAHGLAYDQAAEQDYWLPELHPVAIEISKRIHTQARAAVTSRDEELRIKTPSLPRLIARRALQAGARASTNAALETYEGIYTAVVDDVRQAGTPWPAADGPARRRINATVEPLVTFLQSDISRNITGVAGALASRAGIQAWRAHLEATHKIILQLPGVNERVLRLLRRAIHLLDTPTVANLLTWWDAPDASEVELLFQHAAQSFSAADSAPPETERTIPDLQAELALAVQDVHDAVCAMQLRLLTTAIHQDWKHETPHRHAPIDTSQGSVPATERKERGQNPFVASILSKLSPDRSWQALRVAMEQAEQRDQFDDDSEESFFPSGVAVVGEARAVSHVVEVFILALIVRADLFDGTPPSASFALDHGGRLRVAAETAVRDHLSWLERYGVDQERALQRAKRIADIVALAEQSALDAEVEAQLAKPIRPENLALLKTQACNAFTTFDIVSVLLAWKWQSASATTEPGAELRATVTYRLSREQLTALEPDLSIEARTIGRDLARKILGNLLREANEHAVHSEATLRAVQSSLRTAIGELTPTGLPNTKTLSHQDKIVLLIPTSRQLRETLALTDSERPRAGRHLTASGTAEQPQITPQHGTTALRDHPQFAGKLDGCPALRTNMLKDSAMVLDLGREAGIQPSPIGEHIANLVQVSVEEPQKPGITTVAAGQPLSNAESDGHLSTSPDTDPRHRSREAMPRVHVTLTFSTRIGITNSGSIRVVSIPRDTPSATREGVRGSSN